MRNRDLNYSVKKTIENTLPKIISTYIDDHKISIKTDLKNNKSPDAVLRLVMTLKHWSNPFGNFPPLLRPHEAVNFKELLELLENPEKLTKTPLKPNEKFEVKRSIQAGLDEIANKLIDQYNLSSAISQSVTKDQSAIEKWWQARNEQQQAALKRQFNKLDAQKKQEVASYIREKHVIYVRDPIPDYLFLYWMMHDPRCYHAHHHHLFGLPTLIPDFNPSHGYFSSGANPSGHTGSGYFSSKGSGGYSSSNHEGADAIPAVTAVVGFIALISAGIIGGIYAAKKAFNSLCNALTGNKVLRSLFRLVGISTGGSGGAYAGMVVGGMWGSALPGLGTLAGMLIGGVSGAGLGAGIGAIATKYTAKGLSYLTHRDHLNPTNPEKYSLTNRQKANLRQKNFSIEGVEEMFVAIRREKSKLALSSSFPFTKERKKKQEWNDLLYKLKNDPASLYYPILINNIPYDPSPQRFEFIKSTSYVSSTAQYMGPIFGNNLVPQEMPTPVVAAPSAPPLEVEQPQSELDTKPEYGFSPGLA